METKISQNSLLEASWDLLGRSWGLLGGSWALLGHIFKKTLNKLPPLKANLGAKIDEKSKQLDVKKALVLRDDFFIDFLHFCMDLRSSKPSIFGPNLAMKPKTSVL